MTVGGNATPRVLMVFFPFHDFYLENLVLNKSFKINNVRRKLIFTLNNAPTLPNKEKLKNKELK